MAEVTSPGHKLGQMIGDFFEELFADDLIGLCNRHGFYCDRKGLRPEVRGNTKKVTWRDKAGNDHDLDYVVEKGGAYGKRGKPVALIELAWRRYTKHSRNKTGEIEGSLLHLRDTYSSCGFLGAILAGEYTTGGKNQLTSHGITVFHVPFEILANCFRKHGVDLDYPENASDEHKLSIIRRWKSLSEKDIEAVKRCVRKATVKEYSAFIKVLEQSLLRRVKSIVLFPLYGSKRLFQSVPEAITALTEFDELESAKAKFVKFEIQLRFSDGDKIEATFHHKSQAVNFLRTFV